MPNLVIKKRVLAIVTEAFEGYGGIALYNTDLLSAIATYPNVSEVIVFPRLASKKNADIPPGVTFVANSLGGKLRYIFCVLGYLCKWKKIDLIICAHINLLPVAIFCKFWRNAPIVLEVYGIEAWHASKNWFVLWMYKRVDYVIAISEITKKRFMKRSAIDEKKILIMNNAIHIERYDTEPRKPQRLLDKYHLHNKIVLMTFGRIDATERYKGFDEVIGVLPKLLKKNNSYIYLIAGQGSDLERLREKVHYLGLSDKVIFTGYISEREKGDYYRLADVFIMPSYGEGFGFVFLEAMACGTPVIGSKIDGGREALRHGELGLLVDPLKSEEIIDAIELALSYPYEVPYGLNYFSYENFQKQTHRILDQVFN